MPNYKKLLSSKVREDGRSQIIVRVIERYEKFRENDQTGRLLPFKGVGSYNDNIKRVFKLCGITRPVSVRDSQTGEIVMRTIDTIASSHMARRTFAGNIYNKVKDPNIVCKMTGHVEGSRAFTRYRKIDDEVLIDAVKVLYNRISCCLYLPN